MIEIYFIKKDNAGNIDIKSDLRDLIVTFYCGMHPDDVSQEFAEVEAEKLCKTLNKKEQRIYSRRG